MVSATTQWNFGIFLLVLLFLMYNNIYYMMKTWLINNSLGHRFIYFPEQYGKELTAW